MLTGVISHGCPKNLVDTEVMLGFIEQAGYKTTLDIEKADIVLVNTCAFICDAQKESIASIVELIDREKPVIVAGCLPQKYKEELMKELPEVFAFIGPSDLSKIADIIKDFEAKDIKTIYNVSDVPNIFYPEFIYRRVFFVSASTCRRIFFHENYHLNNYSNVQMITITSEVWTIANTPLDVPWFSTRFLKYAAGFFFKKPAARCR